MVGEIVIGRKASLCYAKNSLNRHSVKGRDVTIEVSKVLEQSEVVAAEVALAEVVETLTAEDLGLAQGAYGDFYPPTKH